MNQSLYPLKSWIPYKTGTKSEGHFCKWLNTFNKPYIEPFFDETITKCRLLDPHITKFSSVGDLMLLDEWASNIDSVKPTTFIFHISRCGSTLVSQLLGLNQQHISLAEVPFFDDILQLPFTKKEFTQKKAGQLFTSAIKFYGQKRNGDETNLFIKADSWHVFYYEQIRELYPDVPFVFLYRRPDEVFNSHQKRRGMQAVPGLIEPALFGFNREDAVQMNQDIYTAQVLERYFGRYLEINKKDKLSIFIDYKDGIMPMIKKIASFVHLKISEDELLKMEVRSQYHSKYPGEAFSEKQAPIENNYLDKAFELYEELNKILV